MKYDIFISYKRGGCSSATAAYLYDLLTKKGYSVFFDRKEIRQGQFNTQLFEQIENATDIIILLDDHSLKACFCDIKDTYKTDWFCMEVMHSLLKQKRIIPLLLEGYCMPDAEVLPEEMKALSLQNAISLDIADIEDFYQKYLIGQDYLASKPRNLYLSQAKGKGIADFLFYSDGECDLFECGNLIGTLNNNTDEDHPYRHPVERCGEHRFYCINNDTCEEQRITEFIDVNSQKYICIKWTAKQNLWELSEDNIQKQNDSRILYAWGKGLFEGTSKHDPNTKLSFLCLKEAANKWNIDARNFIVDHVKGLFSTELTIEDRIAWYEKAIEFDSADAYEILGRYYDEGIDVKQDINKAFEYGKKALQLRIEKYGEMNADVAMSYHNLGRACGMKGDYTNSILYYEKAAEIRIAIYGELHPELAKTLNNLANMYKEIGNDQDALKTYLKTKEIKEKLYGEKHISLANTYNNLGVFYDKTGEFEKAKEILQKALDIKEELLGNQDINTATTYDSFGSLYWHKGEFEKALQYYQKAIEIKEKVLGNKHDEIAESYQGYGSLLQDMGDNNKALDFYMKALEIREITFGSKHASTANLYYIIGELYNDIGDKNKKSEYCEKAISIFEAILKENPEYTKLYNNTAWTLHLLGRDDEALPWAEKAVASYPEDTNAIDTLACVYQDLGRNQKALKQFELCLKLLIEKKGPEKRIKETEEKIASLKNLMKNGGVSKQ